MTSAYPPCHWMCLGPPVTCMYRSKQAITAMGRSRICLGSRAAGLSIRCPIVGPVRDQPNAVAHPATIQTFTTFKVPHGEPVFVTGNGPADLDQRPATALHSDCQAAREPSITPRQVHAQRAATAAQPLMPFQNLTQLCCQP